MIKLMRISHLTLSTFSPFQKVDTHTRGRKNNAIIKTLPNSMMA